MGHREQVTFIVPMTEKEVRVARICNRVNKRKKQHGIDIDWNTLSWRF
jgi:hypothetical protein